MNEDFKSYPKIVDGAIVIPWRPTSSRMKAFNELTGFYQSCFPNLEIIKSDSNSENFNLSASRNLGINQAFESGCKFVVVSDADVFTSHSAISESISNSLLNNTISNPYTVYFELNDLGTNRFFNKENDYLDHSSWVGDAPSIKNGSPSSLIPCSGVNVIPASVWYDIGGFDENFIGWGYEDNAYLIKYFRKYNRLYDFIDGVAVSVYHEKEWADGSDNKEYFNRIYGEK